MDLLPLSGSESIAEPIEASITAQQGHEYQIAEGKRLFS